MKQFLHSLLRKCFFLLVIVLTLHFPSFSQSAPGPYFEAGATVGPMVFMGDLGGHFGRGANAFLKDYNIPTTKIAFGAFLAYHPSEWLGFRMELTYGNVTGDDALIQDKGGEEIFRKNRNLNFRSVILEGMVAAEIYPTVIFEEGSSDLSGRLRPYGVIGVGLFHFNPQGTYVDPNTGQSTWVDLQPLHTEGEGFAEYPGRKNYKLTQLNIPMGVGLKYYFSQNVNLAFEILYRKTFTDYIDDVSTTFIDPSLFYKYLSPSQAIIANNLYNKSPLRNTPGSNFQVGRKRGDPTHTDAYFTAGFKLAIRLGQNSEWNNSTRCPLLRF
jgi:hypothetical protein